MIGIRVSDEGKGIPEPDRERIYAEYFRVDRHSAGGFGLGLAFVNRIVRLHGGEIELESEPRKGSRFCLWLPQREASVVPQAPGPMAILLVEDLKANVLIIRAQLLREGHQVTAAATGEEALELLERERFDLVLMDLQLPGIDGFEATRRLRGAADRRGAETPVFALTTNVLSHTEAACREAGMDAVISKPLRMEEFNATVAAHFGGQGKYCRASS